MIRHTFLDTTVIVNFASVAALDLLLAGLTQGRWTQAVAAEVADWSRSFPELRQFAAALGEPVAFRASDGARIERVRRSFFVCHGEDGSESQADTNPRRHLGEAQACITILGRSEFKNSLWASDDADAREFAAGKGISSISTYDLALGSVHNGEVSMGAAEGLLRQMAQLGHATGAPDEVVGPRYRGAEPGRRSTPATGHGHHRPAVPGAHPRAGGKIPTSVR